MYIAVWFFSLLQLHFLWHGGLFNLLTGSSVQYMIALESTYLVSSFMFCSFLIKYHNGICFLFLKFLLFKIWYPLLRKTFAYFYWKLFFVELLKYAYLGFLGWLLTLYVVAWLSYPLIRSSILVLKWVLINLF